MSVKASSGGPPVQTNRQSLLVKALTSVANAVFITDEAGQIIWVNEAFSQLSGYSPQESLGRTPALLQSGKQGQSFYARLWDTILSGQVWQGEVIDRRKDGTLYVVDEVITPLFDEHGGIANFIAIQHDITKRKKEGAIDHYLAYHDALTGLPNRLFFLNVVQLALANARRGHYRLAILFLDLDGFKPVNDRLGHRAGDKLLSIIAERLSSSIRRQDTVARFGGDEFAILLGDLANRELASSVAAKVLEATTRPFALEGKTINVGASIGVSIFPDDGDDTKTLLTCADRAMYEAKRHGGNCYLFYQAGLAQSG